ncbi:hypothetical protein SKAU_G00353500 [Synaphobranchus kaupii]|uniref:ribonuclease H n=1 Tax=Synaphobranchus kaupii TaxID=118154 RepID=A0A9Q1EL37_SYNKA|nr:hypothetical protein SKAU_G00353500 [Synaphobranchus kaupii]
MADKQAAAAPAPQEITLGLQLVPPGNFDFNNASEWPRWIRCFERFRIVSGLDRKDQAFQVPLAEESSLLTNFITPFGRYAFNRLPFGISSAPEHFQRRMTQMLEGCDGVLCHADDILVYGRDQEEHNKRLHRVLKKLEEEGLTLNEKCEFSKDSMIFVGYGITPDPDKVKAILEMPEPSCVADIRRVMAKAEVCVSADASSYGIGAVLTQKQPDSEWRPVVFISRGLTGA